MRTLIVETRRTYPGASVPLIMRTLIGEGHLRVDAVQPSAIRRLLAEHGLDRLGHPALLLICRPAVR